MLASDKKINKRCLVFADNDETGHAICHVLYREGAEVAFTYHGQGIQARTHAVELDQYRHFHCQLDNEAELTTLLQQGLADWNKLDAVIIAVDMQNFDADMQSANEQFPQLSEINPARVTEVIQKNIVNSMNACRAALPYLRLAKTGNIVLLGSLSGVKLLPAPVHLAAAKSAQIGMTHALAKELGKDNICVNMLAAGIIESESIAQLPEQIKHDYLKHCALGRFAKPSEIAESIAWLALENSYVNGQIITLDGGL